MVLEVALVTTCSGFVITSVCLAIAKRAAPVSKNEARVLWNMHKQKDLCLAHKWKPMKHGKNKIVGFKCECGHVYTQKRPLLSRMPLIQ